VIGNSISHNGLDVKVYNLRPADLHCYYYYYYTLSKLNFQSRPKQPIN